jgi:flagellar P-ring protein precursor FlgI
MVNYGVSPGSSSEDIVHAVNAANIVVRIPEIDKNDPVQFTASILDCRVEDPEPEARVFINSRAGTIIISGDVEIGDVIVSHKNVVVEAGSPAFAPIDADKTSELKLQQLVDQLNSLKVPTADMIEIIRGIDRNGKLHGRLIID